MEKSPSDRPEYQPIVRVEDIRWDCDGDAGLARSLPSAIEFDRMALESKGVEIVKSETSPDYENFAQEVIDLISDEHGFCIEQSRISLLP